MTRHRPVRVPTSVWTWLTASARFCCLLIPQEAGTCWLDDNFFDLPAGRARVVTVCSERAVAAENVRTGHWLTPWP
ncbi:MAG: hypothetical protein A3K19_01090 [Lentisphaerae bacterium RIFOXYB12_FULL_65_16]|nr:MAG: hypothetical protein A3K18_30620 [Lentisphaerae bacterium RIFOXYA12_64_32]OGV93719.1 MAG: hypothetical protein A3K19_01090 [Lentisphaerae bacterium RIFOXYB12_FULL_65_16]